MTKTRICLSACQLINIEFEDNNFKANYTSQFSQMLLVLIVLKSILDFCNFQMYHQKVKSGADQK